MLVPALMEESMEGLVGSWELLGVYRQRQDGTRDPLFGENPRGRLTYTADGVVHAILVGDDRPQPPSMDISDTDKVRLFQTVVAYSGTYRLDGNKVTHAVDVSWNQVWTKTDLVRFFELNGNRLRILTEPTTDPLDGSTNTYIVEWQGRALSS